VLGNIIDQQGVFPNPEKTAAMINAPTPHNVKSVMRLMGMCAWFRKSIPHLSTIARPIYELTKKGKKFVGGEEEEAAFQLIKRILTNPPVLNW
jgi:hypothetical protein